MPATPIVNPEPSESLVGIEPPLLQQVNAGWRHRLNLFTGRTLSATALQSEQLYRSGLLATLGQLVTPGIVSGLTFSIDMSVADPLLTVTPGYGIAASGEDVVLLRALQTRLSTLTVVDSATGAGIIDPKTLLPANFGTYAAHSTDQPAGVFVLQPIVAQAGGQMFDTTSAPQVVSGNLRASCDQDPQEYAFEDWQIADGVRLAFVPWPIALASLPLASANAQPTYRNRLVYGIFDAEAQLAPDDVLPWVKIGVPVALVAFDVRGRLVWESATPYVAGQVIADATGKLQQVQTGGSSGNNAPVWNESFGQTTTDNTIAWLNIGSGTWQAATAYVAEQSIVDANGYVQTVTTAGTSGGAQPSLWNDTLGQTTSDGTVGWTNGGLAWRPLFVDRSAVVRPGGLPRRRNIVPVDFTGAQIVGPALAQSRVSQLSEQIDDQLSLDPNFSSLAGIATSLPPCGVLPAAAMDFENRKSIWLPATWNILAAPVHIEELEAALQSGMLAAPLDPAAAEDVEVLVPLPDAVYDPNILVTETVAPDFQSEHDSATSQRNVALRARKTVQLECNVLQAVLGPDVPAPNPSLIDLNAGLTADEESSRDGFPPFWPQPSANADADQTFGTRGPATWQSATAYAAGQLIIDKNGNFERVQTAGVSGATMPAWTTQAGQTTTDAAGPLTWLNAGSGEWTAGTVYAVGQFIFDFNGSVQTVQTAGTSGASQYRWNAAPLQTTPDGNVTWRNAGPRSWQPNTKYVAGQAVIDANGIVQSVQTEGTSGAGVAWGTDTGQLTPDGGVIWLYEGQPTVWARNTVYRTGQFILDPNGNIQETVGIAGDGTSGGSQLVWNATAGGTTSEGNVTWVNSGPGVWQPATAYAAGEFVIDSNGNLQTVKTLGTSGNAAPVWSTVAGGVTADGAPNPSGAPGLTWVAQVWGCVDLVALRTAANARPYTLSWPAWQPNTVYPVGQIATDSNGNLQVVQAAGTSEATAPSAWGTAAGAVTADGSLKWAIVAGVPAQIPLISADDWTDLATNGLQHFIDRLHAKIKKANDLIDLAFLTTQTDIYRFRQNVLGATDASRLATSPILASIATGVTSTGTAQNLQDYFTSITTKSATAVTGAAPVAAPAVSERIGSVTSIGIGQGRLPELIRVASLSQTISAAPILKLDPSSGIGKAVTLTGTSAQKLYSSAVLETLRPTPQPAAITPTLVQPTAGDIQGQSPIVGAQLDVRTVTIAERLAQPISQESLFYAVGNRTALMQILLDLEITIDDLPYLVDAPSTGAKTIPTETHFVAELRSAGTAPAAFNQILNPFVPTDSDEAGMFSSGVRVLEQHTQLLRALEARVQTYVDFVSLCTTTIGSIQSDVARAQTTLKGLENSLVQARQDLAFTAALLADERQRVDDVTARRRQILQTSVDVVVYTRPRALETEDNVPSRQLVPGNVANPVPAALQQSISAPPELREITALLQEVPLSWLPSVARLMRSLDRPILLQQIAVSTVARAALALTLPLPQSSALLAPSVYGPTIANVYGANQELVRGFQSQRAAFVPTQLTNLSWSSQVAVLSRVTTIADLTSSIAVHAEIASAVALAQQQIAGVATSIYARANVALPADRLAWAEYLRGPGLTVQLQNLSVLPNWNTQSYTDRQQMQLLVDWLFTQIDSAQMGAAAYMSDVIRVSILLASHAPANDVIAGAVTVRTQPVIGKVVSLNLPSARVASGMYVQLFSRGSLAAEAVVNDLDSTSVSATVTTVHVQGVYLEANDVAHFTTQPTRAAALRAFSA